jgi:2-amino-4-hydroxy-6-hydroxymethyldihydropteridine diphosphokinase
MARVFLSLGSNQGDRLEWLRQAVERLETIPGVGSLAPSRIYRAEPWEQPPGQWAGEGQWFLNAVVALETSLDPTELLRQIQRIETGLGRVRGPGTPEECRLEPRTIDIDILLYGERVISASDNLHIPHLLMHERRFVLEPLAELAPDLVHPVLYETIQEILDGLEDVHTVLASDLPARWWQRTGER